jgi:AcrR family transcriptional regulator
VRAVDATLFRQRCGEREVQILDADDSGWRLGEKPVDRRIQRTRILLHEALGSLIREKAYDRITVAQILERAKVSRSTFYIHFRDKDDLLRSSMRALLAGVLSTKISAIPDAAERMVAFSLPLLSHIQQHRRSAKVGLGERGRAILHGHLRDALSDWIVQALEDDRALPLSGSRRPPVNPKLLARHVASTFVLVLHWWLDHDGRTASDEADKLFRALVMPVLRAPL